MMINNKLWFWEDPNPEECNGHSCGVIATNMLAIVWEEYKDGEVGYRVYPVIKYAGKQMILCVGLLNGSICDPEPAKKLLELLVENQEQSSYELRVWNDPYDEYVSGEFQVLKGIVPSVVYEGRCLSDKVSGTRAIYTVRPSTFRHGEYADGVELVGHFKDCNPKETDTYDYLGRCQVIVIEAERGFKMLKLKGDVV